jgi:hypothetical protein
VRAGLGQASVTGEGLRHFAGKEVDSAAALDHLQMTVLTFADFLPALR